MSTGLTYVHVSADRGDRVAGFSVRGSRYANPSAGIDLNANNFFKINYNVPAGAVSVASVHLNENSAQQADNKRQADTTQSTAPVDCYP